MRDRLTAEFGLLLCQRKVARVYEKAGWMRVDGPTPILATIRSYDLSARRDGLKLGVRDWPGGAIDLCGRPW